MARQGFAFSFLGFYGAVASFLGIELSNAFLLAVCIFQPHNLYCCDAVLIFGLASWLFVCKVVWFNVF